MMMIDDYMNENIKTLNSYVQKFSEAGASAVDVQGMSQQVSSLTTAYTDFADTSKGMSIDRFTQLGNNVITQQAKLATMMMNPDTGMKGMQLYMNMISDTTSSYTRFLSKAMSTCLSS